VTHYCSRGRHPARWIPIDKFGLPVVVWARCFLDHLRQQLSRKSTRVKRHNDQPERVAAKFHVRHEVPRSRVVIMTPRTTGKGHNQYFSEQFEEKRRAASSALRRDRRPAGLSPRNSPRRKNSKPDVNLFRADWTPLAGASVFSQMEKLGISAVFQGTSGIKSERLSSRPGATSSRGFAVLHEGAPWEKLPGGLFFNRQVRFAENTTRRPRPTARSPSPRRT